MKVGIMTFHWARHAGAFLQAYSLYNILRPYFHVSVINYLPKLYFILESTINVKKIFIKYLDISRCGLIEWMRTSIGEFANNIFLLGIENRKRLSYEYCLRKLNLTKPLSNLTELRDVMEEFDVVVVGSDQVWNPEFLTYSDYAYLLPFKTRKTRKIAYAASIGVDNLEDIPGKILDMYKKCLCDFDFISLRERTHMAFLSRLSGKEIHHALDPTLLVTKDRWEREISNIKNINGLDIEAGNYIFIYNIVDFDILFQ